MKRYQRSVYRGEPATRKGEEGRTEIGYIDPTTKEFIKTADLPDFSIQSTKRGGLTATFTTAELFKVGDAAQATSILMRRLKDKGIKLEMLEAAAKSDMIAAKRLPRKLDCNNWPETFAALDPWAVVEDFIGIKRVGESGDLLYSVLLPEGWRFVSDGESMWTYLHDSQNRRRASVFYKGAFYDSRANWSLERRYYVTLIRDADDGQGDEHLPLVYCVWDNATHKTVFRGTPYDSNNTGYAVREREEAQARAWLEEHYPRHKDPFEYWQEETGQAAAP